MLQLFSKKYGEINQSLIAPIVMQRRIMAHTTVGYGAWSQGEALIQELSLELFTLRLIEVAGTGKDELICIDGPDSIIFHMGLEGSAQLFAEGLGNMVFHERAYNYYYLPEWTMQLAVRKGSRQRYLQVKIPMFYLKTLASEFTLLDSFLATIRLQHPVRLMRYNQICCERMMDKVVQLLAGENVAAMEYWLAELLRFSLEKACVRPNRKAVHYSQAEVDRMYAAKNLLLDEIDRNYTLQELAHQVGLNMFKLKRGFMEIFGTSAHAIQHTRRMKTAANLLHDERKLTMLQIAQMVGYDAAASFLRAFRQYYGHYPSGH